MKIWYAFTVKEKNQKKKKREIKATFKVYDGV